MLRILRIKLVYVGGETVNYDLKGAKLPDGKGIAEVDNKKELDKLRNGFKSCMREVNNVLFVYEEV